MIGRVIVIGVVALAAAACTGGRRQMPPRERTVLVVRNQGFADMTVYVVAGSSRQRMGIAGGLRTTELTIPPQAVGSGTSISFVADPLGKTRQSYSQEIYVREGDRVTLTIPP